MKVLINSMMTIVLVMLGWISINSVYAADTNEAKNKPNILFVAFDDLRPLIGAYGEAEPKTPNIDAFAHDAVRFDRAYVNYPLCNPSRAAMLTGIRFDNNHDNFKDNKHPKLIVKQTTWPRILKDNGYWTATRGKLYHGNVPSSEKHTWHVAGEFWPKSRFKDGGPEIQQRIVDIGGREDQIKDYLKRALVPVH